MRAERVGVYILTSALVLTSAGCAEASQGAGTPTSPTPAAPETSAVVPTTTEPIDPQPLSDNSGFIIRKHGPREIDISYPQDSAGSAPAYLRALPELTHGTGHCVIDTSEHSPVEPDPLEPGYLRVLYRTPNSGCLDKLPDPPFTR